VAKGGRAEDHGSTLHRACASAHVFGI
jgi:hypothetical protein